MKNKIKEQAKKLLSRLGLHTTEQVMVAFELGTQFKSALRRRGALNSSRAMEKVEEIFKQELNGATASDITRMRVELLMAFVDRYEQSIKGVDDVQLDYDWSDVDADGHDQNQDAR